MLKIIAALAITFFLACHNDHVDLNSRNMIIRIAALEIDSSYLEEYKMILQEEAYASMKLEPGVICILPMYEQEHPTEIRLLEIYADDKAYQDHLRTPHFLKYKKETRQMVQSLELIDMAAIDSEITQEIFRKAITLN